MQIVARYPNPLLAEAAAEFLRQSSIAARSTGRLGGDGITGTTGGGVFEVAVLVREQAGRARELLAEFNASGPQLDPDWEQVSAPDLSRLEDRHRPVCPACGEPLKTDATVMRCPRCGGAANLVELIVAQHGPEALEPCYTIEAQELPDDLVEGAPLACPGCQYPLGGLPPEGVCPECGTPYNKQNLLRGGA